MLPPTYIGEGGNIKSGCDVCDSVILTVITLVFPERLKLKTSNFVRI